MCCLQGRCCRGGTRRRLCFIRSTGTSTSTSSTACILALCRISMYTPCVHSMVHSSPFPSAKLHRIPYTSTRPLHTRHTHRWSSRCPPRRHTPSHCTWPRSTGWGYTEGTWETCGKEGGCVKKAIAKREYGGKHTHTHVCVRARARPYRLYAPYTHHIHRTRI